MDLSKLSATKLQALEVTRAAAHSAALADTIAHGWGMKRHSEIVQLAADGEQTAIKYVAAWDAIHEVYAEQDARKRHSGTMKPIKRAA